MPPPMIRTGSELASEIGEIWREIDAEIDGEVDGEFEGDFEGNFEGKVEGEFDGKVEGEFEDEFGGKSEASFESKCECVSEADTKSARVADAAVAASESTAGAVVRVIGDRVSIEVKRSRGVAADAGIGISTSSDIGFSISISIGDIGVCIGIGISTSTTISTSTSTTKTRNSTSTSIVTAPITTAIDTNRHGAIIGSNTRFHTLRADLCRSSVCGRVRKPERLRTRDHCADARLTELAAVDDADRVVKMCNHAPERRARRQPERLGGRDELSAPHLTKLALQRAEWDAGRSVLVDNRGETRFEESNLLGAVRMHSRLPVLVFLPLLLPGRRERPV
eukprot:132373-Pleurochrysis_carterae.AAC.1